LNIGLKPCIKRSILCRWKRRSYYQFSFLSKTTITNINKNTHITEVSFRRGLVKWDLGFYGMFLAEYIMQRPLV